VDEQTDQAPLAALQLGLFNLARGDEPQTEFDRFTKAGYRPVWVDGSAPTAGTRPVRRHRHRLTGTSCCWTSAGLHWPS
jgi:hypothetical protein